MNTRIPEDPFSGIVLPPLSPTQNLVESAALDPIGVQVSRTDSVAVDQVSVETPGGSSEGGAINVVGADGTLNAVVKHSTWVTGTTYPSTLKTVDATKSVTINTTGIIVNNGTQTARILYADFNKDIQFREMDVCDGGVSKKILVLCSLPYV